MNEPLVTILFLHPTRHDAPSALRTSNGMGNKNQNETRPKPYKHTNPGMPHPIANANTNGQNRITGKMQPGRHLWIISDGVTPPFLRPRVIIFGLMLEFKNDRFHLAMHITKLLSYALRRIVTPFGSYPKCRRDAYKSSRRSRHKESRCPV